MLFTFRLSNHHLDCLLATITSPTHLKLHPLPFSPDGKFNILELAAMKEEVFFFSVSTVIKLLGR